MEDQSEIIDFLLDPGSYNDPPETVELIETHGALVFLAGAHVFKIKRCVKYSYMDFSTLEKRQAACAREIEINQPHAPEIYLGLVTITLEENNKLVFNGKGEPVEWAVHMRRFAQEDIFHQLVKTGGLTDIVIRQLAEVIINFHKQAPRIEGVNAPLALAKTLSGITSALRAFDMIILPEDVRKFDTLAQDQIKACATSLAQRAESGFVRRCHGDLHLQNIVMIADHPVLFDAIEFDERLAQIDVLYDLAFLIMDLDHQGFRDRANLLLNHYLFKQDEPLHYQGLKLMPLFLALRAAIRAMVTLQRGHIPGKFDQDMVLAAKTYFTQAFGCFNPPRARLIAIGGFSGTGKSTLAAALAPEFGAAPGALHLRSDLERKALFAVEETHRLGEQAYTRAVSQKVYDRLYQKAALALNAGHWVIVDAVFSTPEERKRIETIAGNLDLGFTGLWLTAPGGQLRERVDARIGDASDATSKVVQQQIERGAGVVKWHMIDAGGAHHETLAGALKALEQYR